MKRIPTLTLGMVLLTSCAWAGEWSGYLMDTMCAPKMLDKASSHTAECMKNCRQSGYGLVTADGKYIRFNETGNSKALAALEQSDKQDDLAVKVVGELKAGVIHVESLEIQ